MRRHESSGGFPDDPPDLDPAVTNFPLLASKIWRRRIMRRRRRRGEEKVKSGSTSRKKGARGMNVPVVAARREIEARRRSRRGTVRGEGWREMVPSVTSTRG